MRLFHVKRKPVPYFCGVFLGRCPLFQKPFADYLPMRTSSTLMSLGLTPGMRLACASVSGCIRSNFCRHSVERS